MVTRYFPSNLPVDPIAQQTSTVYEDYLKIKGFEDVGYFLIAYVVAGGLATLNITRNDTIDVNDTVVSLNNDVMFRAGTSFSVTTKNAIYYLDFTKEGDFSWSTSHPTGTADTDYLTLATITTDADGNVDVITDTRGTVGGLQLKPDSGWVTAEELADLAGDGRTTETVKGNADDIAALDAELTAHEAETVTGVFNIVTGYGAVGDGATDDTTAIQDAIDAAELAGGGVIYFPYSENEYICQGVTISGSGIWIELSGNTIKKTSGMGYIFDFKDSLTQTNVSIRNGILEGDPTVTANGGVGVANDSSTSYINGFLAENIVCRNIAQYGFSVNAVDNSTFRNIRIENHGSTAEGAASGIGFAIFCDTPQKNCVIDGLYSEINLSSALNSAAIKIQTITNLIATNIHAVNGTEEIMVIDSTHNSIYENILIECLDTTSRPGLSVQSNTTVPDPDVTDASFMMSNVKFKGKFSSAMILADTKNCRFTNFDFTLCTSGGRLIVIASKTVSNCQLIDWIIGQINSVINTGTIMTLCEFINVTCTESALQVRGNSNKLSGCKVIGNLIYIEGDSNFINGCQSISSSSHAFQIAGDTNYILNCAGINPTARNIWIQSGTGNQYRNLAMIAGTGILDSGTGTVGRKRGTTTQRPTLTTSDEGYEYMDTTLAANGKTIKWTGTVWVDVSGTAV